MDESPLTTNPFGDALRAYRERRGASVASVALEVGVHRSYLQLIETQRGTWLNRPRSGATPVQPSRDLVIRLALALGLTVDECDDLLAIAGYAPLYPIERRLRRMP